MITLGEAIGDIEQVGTFEETNQHNHDMFFLWIEELMNYLEKEISYVI